jgi:hypothetical protein
MSFWTNLQAAMRRLTTTHLIMAAAAVLLTAAVGSCRARDRQIAEQALAIATIQRAQTTIAHTDTVYVRDTVRLNAAAKSFERKAAAVRPLPSGVLTFGRAQVDSMLAERDRAIAACRAVVAAADQALQRCEARVAIRDTVLTTLKETPTAVTALEKKRGPVKKVLAGIGGVLGAALLLGL